MDDDRGDALPAAERARLRPLYLRTVITVETDDGSRTYRAAAGSDPLLDVLPLQDAPATLPGGVAALIVLTAHNPLGAPISEPEARRRQQQLLVEVRAHDSAARRVRLWPAVGAAPAGAPPWSEPSVAVAGLPRDEVRALASRYHQRAWFELTPTALRVRWT